jgi:uncharacterized membrane protein
MKRHEFDQVAHDHGLTEPALELALDLTGIRPDARAWLAFAATLLRAAGVGALGAGIIFFVAANWQDYGLIGRFAILQAAFAVCVGLALWRAPPQVIGQSALVVATLLAGALLALFGQSYQTGADVYELFFAWAALALPFALAGRSGALWAVWWCVLNVALALYCGWLGQDHFIWVLLDRWGVNKPALLMLPCAVNLAGAGLFFYLARTQHTAGAPHWLVRMLAAFGFVYGTAACIVVAAGASGGWSRGAESTGQNGVVIFAFAFICAAIAVFALREKKDVFPLALIAGSWIAISTAFLIGHISVHELGLFFIISFWLIATSTASGWMLMRWVRAWRDDGGGAKVTP